MIHTWIHISGKDYWEGDAIVITLPSLPRIGESVYFSDDTMTLLIDKGILSPEIITGERLAFNDTFVVTDICYIENEELPHIMIELDNE